MQTTSWILVALVATAWPALAGPAAGPPRQWSADMTTRLGNQVVHATVSVGPGKSRLDSQMDGHTVLNITRQDKGVTWLLMPDQHRYMELPLQHGMSPHDPLAVTSRADAQFKMVGQATVSGHKTARYRVTVGGAVAGYEYLSPQSLPVRYETADGHSVVDLSNVKVGPQDPSRFEIPAGYQKMAAPPGAGH